MKRAPVPLSAAVCLAWASTVVALFALLGPAPGVAIVPIMAGLAWLGVGAALASAAAHVRGVLEEQRVLGARVAPRPEWPAQSRASRRSMAQVGGALAVTIGGLALVAALVPAAGNLTRSWPGALVAGLAVAGLVQAFVWLGVLAWWGRAHLAWLAGLCAGISGLLGIGWDAALGGLAQAPWIALPALVAGAWATHFGHRQLWPCKTAPAAIPARSPRALTNAAIGRIRRGFPRLDGDAWPLGGIVGGLLAPSFMYDPPQDSMLLQSWASPFDLAALGRLALLAAGMSLCLRTGALHWRLLLAPGGRAFHGLAVDIVLRSWLAALVGLAVMCTVCIPIGWLFAGQWAPAGSATLAWLGGLALRFGPTLLCELLLATAVAAWLRPLMANALAAALACAAAAGLVFAAAGLLAWSGHAAALPVWPREAAHHLGVLVLAAGFTLLANGSWRRADLRRITGPQPGLGEAWRQIVAPLRAAAGGARPGRA